VRDDAIADARFGFDQPVIESLMISLSVVVRDRSVQKLGRAEVVGWVGD
jgi:hypothetical protein